MTETEERAAVVFDPAAVADLTGDAGDATFAVVLVSRYRGLLDQRVRRILTTLAGDDPDETMDAALSLASSSATVGTHELAELGRRIVGRLRRGDHPGAVAAAGLLPDAAVRADRALAAYLAA